jgi:hypothetical protein
MRHPGYSSGFSWSPAEDQSVPAPYTGYPGASYPVPHPAQISVSLHQSEGLIHGSAASFSCLEGDPEITSGVCTSQFQVPLQTGEPGSRDPLPSGARWSYLTGASTNVSGRMSDQ